MQRENTDAVHILPVILYPMCRILNVRRALPLKFPGEGSHE